MIWLVNYMYYCLRTQFIFRILCLPYDIFVKTMRTKIITNFLFGTTRNISEIEYKTNNMIMLPRALKLEPQKQSLAPLIKSYLGQICPNLDQAKESFSGLQKKTENLYPLIKNKILHEPDAELDSSFFQRAHYYFQKEGKKVRPLMILMLAENFKSILRKSDPNYDFTKIDEDIQKWSALMEIMHIASLAHDDIVDDSPSRRGQQSQHLKYGPRIAVFSGNYIISKASKTVSEFESPRLYEIYAHTMASLAQGEIKQLIAKGQNIFVNQKQKKLKEFQHMFQRYMEKSFFKSAALMCGSMLGVPSIFQIRMGRKFQDIIAKSVGQLEQISFRAGQHYGLALQLIDDILDYISTAEQMGKQQMSDLVQGNVTAPVYLTYRFKDNIESQGPGVTLTMLNKRKKNKSDAMLVKEWVESGVGIEYTYILGILHVLEGLKEIKGFGVDEEQLLGWRYLGHKLMTRRK